MVINQQMNMDLVIVIFNVFTSYGKIAMAGPGISFSRSNSSTLSCPATEETYGG